MPSSADGEAVPQTRHGLANSLEAASLRVPFRVKVALVWSVIAILLAVAFARSGFDVGWMIDGTEGGKFIARMGKHCLVFSLHRLGLWGPLGRDTKVAVSFRTDHSSAIRVSLTRMVLFMHPV